MRTTFFRSGKLVIWNVIWFVVFCERRGWKICIMRYINFSRIFSDVIDFFFYKDNY